MVDWQIYHSSAEKPLVHSTFERHIIFVEVGVLLPT